MAPVLRTSAGTVAPEDDMNAIKDLKLDDVLVPTLAQPLPI